ncbi:hypothetical protein PFAG_05325 [Plasmodium falciparum Santa Lucia]|uniref:Uncharacterized protein n=4 Tax=Plasmodium falciparum TaxID=5833 RepID=W4IUY4_PLAFP|nr:hypothetical protein PFFVO_04871 [Plasmodium falciparum Vietnam Oak-Knoll (FVO)]ETW53890.1 hypothetical protein PFUGPA_03763 [Plasmodium falciparum Palo Alto/Uganda]EUR63534.1 hypothetical protein PFBG_05282 [Plasmodium falciparum 7G8]EUR64123.1 hypothetical protein PFBG_05280 [Plasmodium falciparum 7G8]EUT78748.1 hypothetical protein PFAG_05325 [Plasmodium falciparum Santa Lucia]
MIHTYLDKNIFIPKNLNIQGIQFCKHIKIFINFKKVFIMIKRKKEYVKLQIETKRHHKINTQYFVHIFLSILKKCAHCFTKKTFSN